jgi:hypothetical protein
MAREILCLPARRILRCKRPAATPAKYDSYIVDVINRQSDAGKSAEDGAAGGVELMYPWPRKFDEHDSMSTTI